MLKFSRGNAKLDLLERIVKGQVWSFSMLAGKTCPYAKDCLSTAIKGDNGKVHIKDGPHTLFRCFSASQEVIFPAVYNQREYNTNLVKETLAGKGNMVDLLVKSVPLSANVIRLHVSGDFITQSYFDAWLETAKSHPDKVFYAYTKALPFWVKRLGEIPSNMVLTASYGGYRDDMIAEHNLRFAKVVYSTYQARKEKLPIDHNDSHAVRNGPSFALLIHGIQPKGSKASKALQRMGGRSGKSSYKKG